MEVQGRERDRRRKKSRGGNVRENQTQTGKQSKRTTRAQKKRKMKTLRRTLMKRKKVCTCTRKKLSRRPTSCKQKVTEAAHVSAAGVVIYFGRGSD